MAVGTLTEEVAANLEEAAVVTRQLDTRALGFLGVGLVVGAAVGFYIGHRYKKNKIYAEAFAKGEKEVAQIREVYQQKTVAAKEKPSVEEVIEKRGYSVNVIPETLPEEGDLSFRLGRPPVPVDSAKPVYRTEDAEKDKNAGWNYAFELANRGSGSPYIIHQDEWHLKESEYNQTAITYYAEDDILADEDDSILENRDELVGEENLTKFGHGTDDFNILYIRNTRLELEYEVSRVPRSYEEEVLGLEHDPESN